MNVRLANTSDRDELHRLIGRASIEMAKYPAALTGHVLEHYIMGALTDGQPFVVADNAGHLAGYCAWLWLPGTPDHELTGMGTYTEPAFRRQGVCKQMTDLMKQTAKTAGFRFVNAMAHTTNEAGIARLLSAGFTTIGWQMRLEVR